MRNLPHPGFGFPPDRKHDASERLRFAPRSLHFMTARIMDPASDNFVMSVVAGSSIEFVFWMAAVAVASLAAAGLGAYHLWGRKYRQYWRGFAGFGVIAVCFVSMLMTLCIGGGASLLVAQRPPPTLASMEGLFETPDGAPIILVGRPDTDRISLESRQEGMSPRASAASGLVTLGFVGLYLGLNISFAFLVRRQFGLYRIAETTIAADVM